jgi:hypothetical protein
VPNLELISLRIAAALLMKDGHISVADIEAVPFVGNERLAKAIALALANRFDVDWDDETICLARPGLTPRQRPGPAPHLAPSEDLHHVPAGTR